MKDKLIEKLSELEHEQWSHWTKYMLDNLTQKNIEKWKKQINTPYAELSEEEKESDRIWARKTIKTIAYHSSLLIADLQKLTIESDK